MRCQGKNRRYGKGQAAIEFMTTYGWALLIILSVIGALVYFMPNIKSLTTKTGMFAPGLTYMGSQFSSNNLTVVLQNSLAQTIYNVSAKTTVPSPINCTVSDTTLRADRRLTIVCNNSGVGGLNLSSDSKIGINVYYQKTRDGWQQINRGEVYAKYN